jgi:hypothetical protein
VFCLAIFKEFDESAEAKLMFCTIEYDGLKLNADIYLYLVVKNIVFNLPVSIGRYAEMVFDCN